MNKKIGMLSSIINVIAVFSFAICMLVGSNLGSYVSSMFIAFSFIPKICAYAFFSNEKSKVAGFAAIGFAAIYGTIILLVYFAQLTAVRAGGLTQQAALLLDFQQFGLFSADMQGADWVGIVVLEIWCFYFMPVGILSLLHFFKCEDQ